MYCENGDFSLDPTSILLSKACVISCPITQNNQDICSNCIYANGYCDALSSCTSYYNDQVPAKCGSCPLGYIGSGESGCFLPDAQFFSFQENQASGNVQKFCQP